MSNGIQEVGVDEVDVLKHINVLFGAHKDASQHENYILYARRNVHDKDDKCHI